MSYPRKRVLTRPGVRDQRFAGSEAQDVRLCGRAGLPVAGELCGRRVDQGVASRSVAADVAGEVGLVDRAAQRASEGLRAVLTLRISVCTFTREGEYSFHVGVTNTAHSSLAPGGTRYLVWKRPSVVLVGPEGFYDEQTPKW